MQPKSLFMRISRFCVALMIGAFCMLSVSKATEAADLYNVLYAYISESNGDATQCDWIAQSIIYASGTYDVDPFLIASVMGTESNFRFDSFSGAGAIGLMQLMPDTARGVEVDPYNPLDNVIGGTIYLRYQLNNFESWGIYGVTYAVAAYNAGPQAVRDYGGVPPYAETQNYVIKVNNAYNHLLSLCSYY